MTRMIAYRIGSVPHPWDDKARAKGVTAWCLIKVITPDVGERTEEPVAIFNWDSEAEAFQGHVFDAGQDGKLLHIDPDWRELLARRAQVRAR